MRRPPLFKTHGVLFAHVRVVAAACGADCGAGCGAACGAAFGRLREGPVVEARTPSQLQGSTGRRTTCPCLQPWWHPVQGQTHATHHPWTIPGQQPNSGRGASQSKSWPCQQQHSQSGAGSGTCSPAPAEQSGHGTLSATALATFSLRLWEYRLLRRLAAGKGAWSGSDDACWARGPTSNQACNNANELRENPAGQVKRG